MTDLSEIRRDYRYRPVSRDALPADPMVLFSQWLNDIRTSQLPDPTAMSLATVDEQGRPFQRIVLLKRFDKNGFVFFTNYASRKARQITANPQVSLLFPWQSFDRQVIVQGEAEKLSKAESLAYFFSRPKASQIAAWVSKQSSPISSRAMLEAKFRELLAKWQEGEVPAPDFWGGYRVKPFAIEFWQGGESRLHDRFYYQRTADGRWQISQLAP